MARTFAFIAPVHTIQHRVSCSYLTITNAPKHYETYENMSLGSNGVDWVRSLRKIPTWLRGPYFCINCTISHYFVSSLMQLRNDPKCTKTWVYSPMGWIGCVRCEKSRHDFVARTFASSLMELRNDPKCTQTLYNTPNHEFRVQWGALGAFVVKNPDVTSWHEHML